MARNVTDMSAWPSLSLEGNLIAPAMVAKIDHREAAEQSEDTYGVRKGLTIREEVSLAFRVGQAHFHTFAKLEKPSPEATRRFVHDFLKETFAFSDLVDTSAVACVAGGRVPVVVVPPSESLDRRSPTLSTDRSRSPAFALQDYLNEHEEALWGLVTNGTHLRLLRDNASLTRPAHIEADLTQIFDNEDAASFAVLWLIIHRSRFGVAENPATDCALERWRDSGAREGEAARDRLAGQVEIALRTLGSGFLEINSGLAARIQSGELPLTLWFNELLRLVYRLIFLMVAEDRDLLHPVNVKTSARTLYADGYGLAVLRAHCTRASTWDYHHDRYEGMKVVFRALATGENALALPALGGLFDADQLPNLASLRLRNRAFMEAVYRLSWLREKSGMVPINWRAMETEELGSVYESLLELQPQLADDGRALVFASDISEQKGNQRKTTGSYYTPDSLVQTLLDTTLDPVLDRTEAEADEPGKALLELTVIDPACGSGHFLLAAARRIATRLARIRAQGTPSLADFRHALRDVARCCVHGVDRNPMAVELTKVALWIETVNPGFPLGFFDAQIRCGDALLGVFDLEVLEHGIPDAAYKPLAGDDKEAARYYLKVNRDAKAGQASIDFNTGKAVLPAMKPLAGAFAKLRNLPEETVQQIGAKAVRFQELREGPTFVKAHTAADLYVAAFLLPKTGGVPAGSGARIVPTTEEVWLALDRGTLLPSNITTSKSARQVHAFHWPLEFPHVMAGNGFDVVLGNPPWEVMQVSDKEFFAVNNSDIAKLKGSQRKEAIDSLQISDPVLYSRYQVMKRLSNGINTFIRNSDRFNLSSKGKINTYAIFSELSLTLLSQRARSGLIVPTEILTSETLADFIQHLLRKKSIRSAFSFENEEFIFPSIANVVRFTLLTISRGFESKESISTMNYVRRIHQLDEPHKSVDIEIEDIPLFSPNLGTLPIFRSSADYALAKKLFLTKLISSENKSSDLNIWGLSAKQGLFNMSSDSNLFFRESELQCDGLKLHAGMIFRDHQSTFLPLYEGKFVSHFDHRFSSYHNIGKEKGRGGRGLPPIKREEYQNPEFEILPRYWVEDNVVVKKLNDLGWRKKWLLVWRDIANAKVERTVTMAFIPATAVGHNCSILFSPHEMKLMVGLCANLNSLVLDYCARQIVGGTHVTFGYLKQLPILPISFYTQSRMAFLVPRVLQLSYTSHSLTPFARELGYSGLPSVWHDKERAHLRSELDAFYARAYRLTRDELRYILDPSDVKGPDYPSETFRVLKEREIREYGEYRTRRLVLAAWERMETSGEFRDLEL